MASTWRVAAPQFRSLLPHAYRPIDVGVASMSEDVLAAKDAALREVGRTVVNFQRLEHNLKILARLGPIEGTLSRIQRDFERRTEKADSFTLGQAICAWLEAIEIDRPQAIPTGDLFEPTLRGTFSIGRDSEVRKAHGETLKALLAIRNNLVHGGLVKFDWKSRCDCESLVEVLTDLNESIVSQLDFLAAIAKGVQSIREEDFEIEESDVPNEWVLTARTEGGA